MNIALVGNQNCGKTTLFNALTGSNQKVGNWAGVTVEKKTGIIKGTSHTLIDLPGIYSLTPYTAEEAISRNYILIEKPDLIINLIDATCLERSLYLTTQLLQQNCNIIIALNMCENLQKKGQVVDENKLQNILKVPCIKINALNNENLPNLVNLINKNMQEKNNINIYSNDIENLINKITDYFTPKISKFCAIEILENYTKINKYNTLILNDNIKTSATKGDKNKVKSTKKECFLSKIFNKNTYNTQTKNENILIENKHNREIDNNTNLIINNKTYKFNNLKSKYINKNQKKLFKKLKLFKIDKNNNENNLYDVPTFNYNLIESDIISLQKNYTLDICHILAFLRYDFIENVLTKCLTKTTPPPKQTLTTTQKLDKIFLNKFLAIPIFIFFMALMYFLSVGVIGKYSSSAIASGFNGLSCLAEAKLSNIGVNKIIISLLCNGIIAGVGSVLNFVPQLIILFLYISLLETTGYMSRISFILDNFFNKIGLSGKSLIPFIVGSGCSVPAIMSTRTIEDSNEKQTAIILTPFIPCSAKLPIISLFVGFFFGSSWLVTTLIYIFSILLIIICAYFIRKFILPSFNNSLIFELPEYKKPSFKYVLKDVTQKTTSFIKRAGSTILICSVIVWFLVSFNWKLQYDTNIQNSILASIGNLLSWVFYPFLGTFSWGATVSALQGLIAKEQVISSMTIIAGISENGGNLIFSPNGVFGFFTPVTALAFLVFNLFSAPCFSAITTMKKELGSTKKTIIAVTFQIITALIIANLVTLFGNLIVNIF